MFGSPLGRMPDRQQLNPGWGGPHSPPDQEVNPSGPPVARSPQTRQRSLNDRHSSSDDSGSSDSSSSTSSSWPGYNHFNFYHHDVDHLEEPIPAPYLENRHSLADSPLPRHASFYVPNPRSYSFSRQVNYPERSIPATIPDDTELHSHPPVPPPCTPHSEAEGLQEDIEANNIELERLCIKLLFLLLQQPHSPDRLEPASRPR